MFAKLHITTFWLGGRLSPGDVLEVVSINFPRLEYVRASVPSDSMALICCKAPHEIYGQKCEVWFQADELTLVEKVTSEDEREFWWDDVNPFALDTP